MPRGSRTVTRLRGWKRSESRDEHRSVRTGTAGLQVSAGFKFLSPLPASMKTASSNAAQWACASRRSAWAPGRARPRERPSSALPRWAGPRRTQCCNTKPHRPSRTRGRARHGKSRRTQKKGGAQLRPRPSCLTATLRAIICHGRLQIGESSIDGADGCIAHVLKRLRGQSSPAPAGAVYEYRLIRIRTDVLDLHLEEAARYVYRTRNRIFRVLFGLTNV